MMPSMSKVVYANEAKCNNSVSKDPPIRWHLGLHTRRNTKNPQMKALQKHATEKHVFRSMQEMIERKGTKMFS